MSGLETEQTYSYNLRPANTLTRQYNCFVGRPRWVIPTVTRTFRQRLTESTAFRLFTLMSRQQLLMKALMLLQTSVTAR